MNSRERVLAVLEGRTPDRLPVMEMFYDPKVIHSVQPGMSYEDFVDWADIDVVTCITVAESLDHLQWVDKDKGLWRDKWGAVQHLTEDVISVVMEPARIETDADLAAYTPPDPARSPVLRDARELVRRFKGRRAIAVVGECSFAPAQYLRAGLASLMIDYVERPDFSRKLAQVGVDYHVELYRRLLDEGVEIVVLGDDFAGKSGPFMSPRHFQEFILPGLKAVADAVHHKGGRLIIHTDGDIWLILDLLLASGADGLGPLEPAYMRLDEVRRHSGFRTAVVGNVDVDLLGRGTPDQVREATRELIRRVSPLGGHILSSGNTASSAVRGENYMAMLEVARTEGRYPMKPVPTTRLKKSSPRSVNR